MEIITKILHIGDSVEYRQLAHLLGDVHHRDYQLISCKHHRLIDDILSTEYDVILLDYHWGGLGEAKNLLITAITQGCGIPILVMTDEMEADVDREAIQLGASDYLIKGKIDSQLLERTIRYAIERKMAESKLARLAHYDALTEVPNRILFRDRIEHAIQRADREKKSFTLMYLDLDGFKQVNDNFGHDVGDHLIRSCADRLVESMRRSDSVARMGGDEFTLLLEHPGANADMARVANKVIARIEEPHEIFGLHVLIKCSIGIATYPEAGRDALTLLRNADKAMYKAKRDNDSAYRFFTEAMNVDVQRQILLESDLRRGIERKEFSVVYQPRICLYSQETLGFHALIRWYHPVRGWLDADDYYDLAEGSGLIVPILEWAFKQICDDLHCLHQTKTRLLPICLSLTQRTISDANFLQMLKNYRSSMRMESQYVEFALDEELIASHHDTSIDVIGYFQHWEYSVVLTNVANHLSSLPLLTRGAIKRLVVAPALMQSSRDESKTSLGLLLTVTAYLRLQMTYPSVDEQLHNDSLQHLASEVVGLYSALQKVQLNLDKLPCWNSTLIKDSTKG